MTKPKLISVDQALSLIKTEATPLPSEIISTSQAYGRILAADIIASFDHPPFAASAMDGYAVRFSDLENGVRQFQVVGESAAGQRFTGPLQSGQTVRIFTGAVTPEAADHVIIQEHVTRRDEVIEIDIPQPTPRNIRRKGIDFETGKTLLAQGQCLSPEMLGLISAANVAQVSVIRKPIVALLATGNELVEPGTRLKQDQIINSTTTALGALIEKWGGIVQYNGIAEDTTDSINAKINQMAKPDVVVPVGGASVGDQDLVKPVFCERGTQIIFDKVAIKPGKPTWFGTMENVLVLGLPGNPASALVCAHIFLRPLIANLIATQAQQALVRAIVKEPLPANGPRETYSRGRFVNHNARLEVVPMPNQDSSLLSPFQTANCLLRRNANAPSAKAGDIVDIMPLDRALL